MTDMQLRRLGNKACTFNIAVALINSIDAVVIRDKYSYDPKYVKTMVVISSNFSYF